MFDLGRPDRIWHPLVMWNPHSVMFEVAWCVIALHHRAVPGIRREVFENFACTNRRVDPLLISVPLMIVGVILSTLHQSSLGSLYLIVPEKLYPLWYTRFCRAVLPFGDRGGPGDDHFRVLAQQPRLRPGIGMPLLSSMARVLAVLMSVYIAVRLLDMFDREVFGLVVVAGSKPGSCGWRSY